MNDAKKTIFLFHILLILLFIFSIEHVFFFICNIVISINNLVLFIAYIFQYILLFSLSLYLINEECKKIIYLKHCYYCGKNIKNKYVFYKIIKIDVVRNLKIQKQKVCLPICCECERNENEINR